MFVLSFFHFNYFSLFIESGQWNTTPDQIWETVYFGDTKFRQEEKWQKWQKMAKNGFVSNILMYWSHAVVDTLYISMTWFGFFFLFKHHARHTMHIIVIYFSIYPFVIFITFLSSSIGRLVGRWVGLHFWCSYFCACS